MTLTIAEEKLEEVRQKLQFWIDDASPMTFIDCESLLGQLFHVCKCALLLIIIIIIIVYSGSLQSLRLNNTMSAT